ncbi:MAG TPA: HipA family kinase [Kofleriaceae bacterium]
MVADVKRVIRVLGTSTQPIEAELDDGRRAFVKVQGNPEGPAALACELIGTRLAAHLGLATFEMEVARFPDELCAALAPEMTAEPGPCVATTAIDGISWDGSDELLDAVENPEHIATLVLLDTWLRNPDRYMRRGTEPYQNLGNVFLAETGASRGSYRLLAIDHTHCIRRDRELGARCLAASAEEDTAIYGLFPAFESQIEPEDLAESIRRLDELARSPAIDDVIDATPAEWIRDVQIRRDLSGFLKRRAAFVAANMESWLVGPLGWTATTRTS